MKYICEDRGVRKRAAGSLTLQQQASGPAYCCLWTGTSSGCAGDAGDQAPSVPQTLADPPYFPLNLPGPSRLWAPRPILRGRRHLPGAPECPSRACRRLWTVAPLTRGAIAARISQRGDKSDRWGGMGKQRRVDTTDRGKEKNILWKHMTSFGYVIIVPPFPLLLSLSKARTSAKCAAVSSIPLAPPSRRLREKAHKGTKTHR